MIFNNMDMFQFAGRGSSEGISALLSQGAAVNAQNEDGLTALHFAVMCRQLAACTLLLQSGADPNLSSTRGLSSVHFAVAGARYELLESARAPVQTEAPHDCAQDDNEAVALVELLLRHGGDPTRLSGRGVSPLHMAARACPAICACLMTRGARVQPARDGRTALHEACAFGNEATALVLLRHGASVAAVSRQGLTPLHEAARVPTLSSGALIKLLMTHGADIDARTARGLTALDLAVANDNELARLALERSRR
eukprot:m.243660 g.243660  ORF g.243660 m.243660 type:complete len:254 (-) comp28196_c0_seq1:154-915(-)